MWTVWYLWVLDHFHLLEIVMDILNYFKPFNWENKNRDNKQSQHALNSCKNKIVSIFLLSKHNFLFTQLSLCGLWLCVFLSCQFIHSYTLTIVFCGVSLVPPLPPWAPASIHLHPSPPPTACQTFMSGNWKDPTVRSWMRPP